MGRDDVTSDHRLAHLPGGDECLRNEPVHFAHRGIRCAIEAQIGVNGYVQLPADHPWLEGGVSRPAIHALAHGGITYGPDEERWIGFDTAHAFDVWPREEFERLGTWTAMQETIFFTTEGRDEVWWSVERVMGEVRGLADQVLRAGSYDTAVFVF